MHRYHLNPTVDRQVFSKSTRVHAANTVSFVMRGGIRK